MVVIFVVVVILLLNVMEVLSVGGGTLLDSVWSSKEFLWCTCDPSVHPDIPSIGLFVYEYVGSYLLI